MSSTDLQGACHYPINDFPTGIPLAGNSIMVDGELTLFGPTHSFGLPLPFNSQFFGEI